MKYEFRADSLIGVVRKSLSKATQSYERKSSATIETDIASYNWERLSVDVERGRRYTISWSAHEPTGDGGIYAITIRSHDGHGSVTDEFRRSGSWDFIAHTNGEIEFSVGVSRSFGAAWFSYPIDVSID